MIVIRHGRRLTSYGHSQKGAAMRKSIGSFLSDDRGMETVEWAVLAALIVAGLIAVITALGGNVLAKFTTLRDATT